MNKPKKEKKKIHIPPNNEVNYYVKIITEQLSSEHEGGTGRYEGYTTTTYSKELVPILTTWQSEDITDCSYPRGFTSTKKFGNTDAAWLVWVTYSDGGTFGTSVCVSHDLVALFDLKDLKSAQALKQYIIKMDDSIGTKTYKSGDGQVLKIYPSWAGYFSSICEVRIDKVNVFNE